MKFEVCEGVDSGFNGGFVVTEPTCMTIVVVDEGQDDPNEWTATIPFGVPEETCHIATRLVVPDGWVHPLRDEND